MLPIRQPTIGAPMDGDRSRTLALLFHLIAAKVAAERQRASAQTAMRRDAMGVAL
jgi:hypothetical protein